MTVENQDAFTAWILAAIGDAIESLDVSRSQVIVLIQDESGEKHTIVSSDADGDGNHDAQLAAARSMIADFDTGYFYSLIWSGTGKDNLGQPAEVIAIESGSRNGMTCFLTQPYKVSIDNTLVKLGGPLISSAPIDSLWETGEVVDDEVSEEDEDSPLVELVVQVFEIAIERLHEGNAGPFGCLAIPGEEVLTILDPGESDATSEELIDSLRTDIATLD